MPSQRRHPHLVLIASASLALAIAGSSSVADTEYEYDDLGRLISATYDNGVVIEYDYDAAGNRTAKTLVIDNDAPTGVNDSYPIITDYARELNVLSNDTDPEGDFLIIESVTGPSHGAVQITSNGTRLSYTPAQSYTGSDGFSYDLKDPFNSAVTASVSITVVNNQLPEAVDDEAEVEWNESITVDVLANDSDADGWQSLTITQKSDGSNGTVEIIENNTKVRYSPDEQWFGEDEFTYTISDGHGGSDTATVNVTVDGYQFVVVPQNGYSLIVF